MRYRWKAVNTYEISGFKNKARFIGRLPEIVEDEKFRDALIRMTGVFEAAGQNALRFVGTAEWIDRDGAKLYVDVNGFVEIDWDKFTKEQKKVMINELEEIR